jgi:hypothetical protein
VDDRRVFALNASDCESNYFAVVSVRIFSQIQHLSKPKYATIAIMKSPFPGMDPYLEARWPNVHVLMMGAITAALNRTLPEGLEARPEEEVRVETIVGEPLQSYRADVAVVEHAPDVPATSSATVAQPLRIPYRHAPMVLRNVQIVDTRNADRVVTIIEVLSPWNKLAGKLNRQYVRKLRDFEAASTNWVEIDLLRGSRDRLPVTWKNIPADKHADYVAITYRADDENVSVFPISLRDPLPAIQIPLRDTDENVALNLQAVLDRVYDEGRFASLDYSKPPVPPLTGDAAKWANDLLKAFQSDRPKS